jgi:hypothetical protein
VQGNFEDAKATFDFTSEDITAEFPEVPEVCEAIVVPLRQQITDKLASLNDDLDFVEFLSESVCSGIANEVDFILAENENLVPDIIARLNSLIGDIMLIQGNEGDDAFAFEINLRNDFSNLDDPPVGDSGLSTPTSEVPASCESYANYAALEQLISFANDQLAFEAFLIDRLSDACGDSQNALTDLATVVESDVGAATAAKEICISEFYDAFGGDESL